MKITFLGAAHEVTGSCTMVESGGRRILIDCGMEQGEDTFEIQTPLAGAASIDCVLLTHAHIDHSGNLPLLYKEGFKGEVYSTEATYHLCEIMLMDSAHIQMAEVERKNRKGRRSGNEPFAPLYDVNDAMGVLKRFRPCSYGRVYQIFEGVSLRFVDAGHLLGSASIELWLEENGETRKLVFSGDIGNEDKPLMNDPQTIAEADFVVMESTYGNRMHGKEKPDFAGELSAHVERTLARGGNVIIPSFAVGRAQEMLYLFREVNNDRLSRGLEPFTVYLDSPMADAATSVFLQCDASCFDEDTRTLLAQGINPLFFKGLNISETTDESRRINENHKPKVIISSSGMCEAGRIRHHLKHNLWQKNSLVLFVGYQAVGTLGRLLCDGVKKVRLFGEEIHVAAEIATMNGVSGHADKQGLLNWLGAFERKPRHVFVNHGDDESCKALSECLTVQYGYTASAPYSGTEYDLITGLPLLLTEGVRTEKRRKDPHVGKAFRRLLAAVERLAAAVRGSEGLSNKELAKTADQIDQITNKLLK